MNFMLGKCMETNKRDRTILLFMALVYNLVPLTLFKICIENLVLPIGISFFTFQNLSYILDVYKHQIKAETSLINYGAYISMFPQLIAGPIITYKNMQSQLRHRKISFKRIKTGMIYFILGLGAKVLIANRIGTLWNDIQMIGFESITTQLAWLGIIAYCLQLYYDFWGYSLMAIGMGKMLGFCFPNNFDAPYRASNMSDFFRRWHMTLGNWFRDYVYIPLGGSRCSKFRNILNLLIVWILTSLWHGIQWNFLLWGIGIFILIAIEKAVLGKWLDKHKVIGRGYVICIIPIMWLTFLITDFQDYCIYLSKLFPFSGTDNSILYPTDYLKYFSIYWPFFLAGFIFLTKASEDIMKKYYKHIIMKLFLISILGLSVYCMYKGLNDPFLYFRF